MKKRPFNMILLGDPASGKATQAAYFAKKHRMVDFDMGKEVMKPAARAKHDFAKTTGRGKLTPTNVAREISIRIIGTSPKSKGILFDGHPKMIGEAKLIARLLRAHKRKDPLVMYLKIPRAEILKRTASRRILVRGKWVRRTDDDLKALENRRKYYEKQVSQVVAFFRKKYHFETVSGVGTRAVVRKRIERVVQDYLRRHEE